ncbi:hypothetical protein PoB_005277000 [Plakobranchus ocellatus]|uniref:Uncharacterized protein n=1 Tax=Plakobranchus ocellatus TaxID=259542 RepID=A0AAV4C4G1_9GAST|nr:hypothetical protein PoB_005277000 [Plakobranchus ocellatus]
MAQWVSVHACKTLSQHGQHSISRYIESKSKFQTAKSWVESNPPTESEVWVRWLYHVIRMPIERSLQTSSNKHRPTLEATRLVIAVETD